MNQRFTGTVKWVNHRGGFGFIKPDNSEWSVYVDSGESKQTLSEGQRVEFSMMATPRGPRAAQVVRAHTMVAAGH